MTRRVIIIGSVLFVLVVAALVVSFIPQMRLKANFAASQNNLRELALFGAHHVDPKAPIDPKRNAKALPTVIPPGTIVLLDTPPDQRLSWVVTMLPAFDQRRQNVAELFAQIDQKQPWPAEINQKAGRTRLVTLLCPENTPEVPVDAPAITCYVGISGVGIDAASLPPDSPKAGAFRYDSPTPFDRITDGLSQTLLFAETRNEVGPWLRGGTATIRGLNDSADALPLVGGQFGGYFPNGANFALCDGGVRVFTSQTSPQVLLNLATIAGKEVDPLPGE